MSKIKRLLLTTLIMAAMAGYVYLVIKVSEWFMALILIFGVVVMFTGIYLSLGGDE